MEKISILEKLSMLELITININNNRKIMNDTTFDNNYNSNIGKALRKLNEKIAEYFNEPSDELFGMMVTPISNYITSYYWEDRTAKQVFDIIVRTLSDYDMICYNEDTKEYKTYLDKSIVIRLNKIKNLINNN